METSYINDLANRARAAGLKLENYSGGEEVTEFRQALCRATGLDLSLDTTMSVIDRLAAIEEGVA